MSAFSKKKNRDILSLFSNHELKALFKNYLILMGIVETFILLVCLTSQIGPDHAAFPWKHYFFAAFIIPVAITFLFGLIVMAFNKCIYDSNPIIDSGPVGSEMAEAAERKGYLYKFQLFLYSIRQVPFLVGVFLLGICAGVIYKIDTILLYVGRAGEKTAYYFLVISATVLAVAVVMVMIWMILNYKLRKQRLDYEHQYRSQVVERTGMIILDDDTVLDPSGEVLTKGNTNLLPHGNGKKGNMPMLPSLPKGPKNNVDNVETIDALPAEPEENVS